MVRRVEIGRQHAKDLTKSLESHTGESGFSHFQRRECIPWQGILVIAAAAVMMACFGGIYAWSLLVAQLQAEGGFSALETQLVFGTVVLVLCASTLVAGPLQQKAGPRTVSVLGALLYGGGYLLAANAGSSFFLLWLGAGLLVGLGTGAGYISAIATAVRWLPGRKGLATGIVVGGYGSGAIFSKMLFQSLIGRGWQVESVFLTLALGYGGAIILTALCLRPPADPDAVHAAPVSGDGSAAVVRRRDLLRNRHCWRMFFALLFGNIPGLMIIGSFAPIARELGHSPGIAGLGISTLAIGNCAGRVGWGALFDRIGGGKSVVLSLATIIVSVLLLVSARAAVPMGGFLMLLAALTVGLGFASCLVLHAAESAKRFGSAGMSAAYPLIFQAHGLGALIGSALGGYAFDATGSYQFALWLSLASGAAALSLYLGPELWRREESRMVKPTALNGLAGGSDRARLLSMKRTFWKTRQHPAVLGRDADALPAIKRCLVLAPHPDDFDVVAVTLRRISASGTELHLEVLTSGASGVEDVFAEGWSGKTLAREAEQRASCGIFGLAEDRIRFHRLAEDEDGHMESGKVNESRVWTILDRVMPDAVILPHGSDSNADHQRTFQMFASWAEKCAGKTLALLVRDPKTLEMRLDLVTPFNQGEAEWKAEMLRCHASQHDRNLRSRGYGIDERILRMNREIASQAGCGDDYAEGFEIREFGNG